jgi:hypothetical protein
MNPNLLKLDNEVIPSNEIDKAMEDYLRFYRGRHNELARLYPGILDLLIWLKQRGRPEALMISYRVWLFSWLPLCLAAPALAATPTVTEAYRSQFGALGALSVNAADGSFRQDWTSEIPAKCRTARSCQPHVIFRKAAESRSPNPDNQPLFMQIVQ